MAQTATTSLPPLPPITLAWFDRATGLPTQQFGQWADAVDRVLRSALFGTLINAASDADAAKAGVPVGGFYRLTNTVMIRLV